MTPFGEKRPKPLIVSFYADRAGETTFADYADRFIGDCKALNLEHCVEQVKLQIGCSWSHTCRIKPFFIHRKMLQLHRPLLWVDVDSRILADPVTLFTDNDPPFDFAAVVQQLKSKTALPFLASTLYFDCTGPAFELLERWKRYCNHPRQENYGDHHRLVEAVQDTPGLRWIKLPAYYSDFTVSKNTCITFVQSAGVRHKLRQK